MIMGIDLKNKLFNYTSMENIKLEILNIYLDTCEEAGVSVTKDDKDFIVETAENLIDQYSVNMNYSVYKIGLTNKGSEMKMVPIDEMEKIIKEFQLNIIQMTIHIIYLHLQHKNT